MIISPDIFSLIDLVIYDWFERENSEQGKYHGHQYKLGLTKQQYHQMKMLVSPMGTFVNERDSEEKTDLPVIVVIVV